MGEVVISSDSELETGSQKQRKEMEEEEEELEEAAAESRETEDGENGKKWRRKRKSGGDRMVSRWDKFLSRMALRVLLVEADDSTRQIIAALLRKCSYRVAAVSDGLKAWEVLKRRSHNIDLILTEVDLPSISGYALLTLIMEHNICKNIPVIMMSSQDSVSTVYKCMLRGAADYLVKPIRRNELRNLWQHVWRRRQTSLIGGSGVQDESIGQDKAEASSENNAASNRSNGDMACMHISKELAEKGSDAQSSCTKPELEAENVHTEKTHQSSQSLWGNFLLSAVEKKKQENDVNCSEKLLMHEGEARVVSASKDANARAVSKEVESQSQRTDANISLEACDNNENLLSTTEAVDFISGYHKITSINVKNKFDSSPHLDLSLKRSLPSDFEGQVTDGRHTISHSNASAFTRYTNKTIQPLFSTSAGSSYQQDDAGVDLERKLSSNFSGHHSDAPGPSPITQRSDITLATRQTEESQIAACSKQRVLPIQVPVRGVTSNTLCTGYDSAYYQASCKQSGSTKMTSTSSANQPESSFWLNPFNQSNFESNSRHLADWLGKNVNNSTDKTHGKHDYKLDSCDDRGHISPATDQSASNSVCNGAASHFNSMGYGSTSGSNSNVDQVAVVRTAAESNSEGVFMHSTQSHRSIQREAALTKFRMKRKDRCYEKKVRYESRKKLAEQRPRVKGQFVRQVSIAAPPETD